MFKRFFALIPVMLLVISCASSFKRIEPSEIEYINVIPENGLEFSYKYNVLQECDNNKYASKESTGLVKVVSVKIVNNSGKDIVVKDDLQFLQNYRPVEVVSPVVVKRNLKQGTAAYLFYLLLTPLQLHVGDGNDVDSYPIGLIVGPGLAFGNLFSASAANSKLEENVADYNINAKTVKDGETIYGLLCINSSSYEPLSIELK